MALSEAQIGEKEKLPLEERLTTPEIPPEIEHVEAIAGAEITLPRQALHLKIIYSLRWLAEWVKRLTKIFGGNFLYRFK